MVAKDNRVIIRDKNQRGADKQIQTEQNCNNTSDTSRVLIQRGNISFCPYGVCAVVVISPI